MFVRFGLVFGRSSISHKYRELILSKTHETAVDNPYHDCFELANSPG